VECEALFNTKNISLNLQTVYKKLGYLEAHSINDTLAKEVLGINIPKILCTRTMNEKVDVATSEIGNTIAFTTGGLLLNKLLDFSFTQAKKGIRLPLSQKGEEFWRSTALYSAVFSLMWAMPFIRNYITAKRTGFTDFSSFIVDKPQFTKNNSNTDQLESSLKGYRKKAKSILGMGALGAFLSIAIGSISLRTGIGMKQIESLINSPSLYHSLHKKMGLPSVPENLLQKVFKGITDIRFKDLLLKKGQFSNFSGLPALLFWGVPAYGGWIHASRDPYEKKEQLLKFASFTACFFVMPLLIKKFIDRLFHKRFPEVSTINYKTIQKTFVKQPKVLEAALFLWAARYVASLGSSILLLGVMPQLINIKLTEKRMKRAEEAQRDFATSSYPSQTPVSPFSRESSLISA
jgi:hypothetical protein